MRKILVLAVLLLAAYIAVNRQRIYLWDPLGAVYRNDVKQADTRVFINYSNDVLVQRSAGEGMEQFLVQGWNRVPGVPERLTCIVHLACLAQADRAPASPLVGVSAVTMSSRQVTFVEPAGTTVRVSLR